MNQVSTHPDRLQNMETLAELVRARASSNREFRRAVGVILDDLGYIYEALQKDSEIYRLNRAFHVVHIPSMITAISMLDEIDKMATVTEDEMHQILTSLHRAVQLARDARRRIEQVTLTDAKVELSVLSGRAAPPATTFQKASRFSRAMDQVASVSANVWTGAKTGATVFPALASGAQGLVTGVASRAGSIPALTSNLQKTLAGHLSDNVSKPVSMRLNASSRALKNGVGTGVGLGVIVGTLFPPLLPLSAGGAVLAAMRTWRKEMDKTSKLNQEAQQIRVAELQAERSAALRQLAYGADALQMETDELSMMLDVETGQADAVILKGEYSGSTWSSLTKVQKAEVVLVLGEGAVHILGILAAAASE